MTSFDAETDLKPIIIIIIIIIIITWAEQHMGLFDICLKLWIAGLIQIALA